MGVRCKQQQYAASRTAASCVKFHVNNFTESDEPSSSAHSRQPVTIEQISSLLQASQAAFKAELLADLKTEFQGFKAALKAKFHAS